MSHNPIIRGAAIDSTFVPHPRQGVTTVEIEGDAVIYDEELERSHLLNPTAALIWRLLDGRSRVSEVSADIAEVYAVDLDTVLTDVLALVQDLGRRGLLEGVPADAEDGAPSG
jgi:hypothetical protein